MNAPLAYLLTWTTYGTWLHGDPRGSVDRLHNAPRTPLLEPDERRHEHARRRLKHEPVTLSRESIEVVDRTIRDHCEHRRWRLHALNVRTNHVHVAVTCEPECSPEHAMEQLKSWCTRRLREEGLIDRERPVWTEHASTRRITTDDSLRRAIEYVTNEQGPSLARRALWSPNPE